MNTAQQLNDLDPDWAWEPFQPTADQPWDTAAAAHLFRRAGFAADHPTLESAVHRDPVSLVNEWIVRSEESTDFRVVADQLAKTIVAGRDPMKLSAAWVYRLLYTPNQLPEKVTLFWHGHFATSAAKVNDSKLMWQQNQLLRDHALGAFPSLVQAIAKDPAMLLYLDSASNRKAHPNENFARELMELFCLGEGNYGENDVLELARCFTGWEVRNNQFRKNRYQHDTLQKQILGQADHFDGEQAVEVVLQQDDMPLFLCRKWFRYFVCDEPTPSDELLAPLATCFRENNFETGPVIQKILQSNLFFSKQFSVARRIKSPVELIIGALRALGGTANTELVAQGLLQIGQGLFYPPNVKGWDGGRAWINSSTLLGRSNLLRKILAHKNTRFGETTLKASLTKAGVQSIDEAIEHFEICLLAVSMTTSKRDELRESFSSESNPSDEKLQRLLHAVLSLPEAHLA